MALPAMKIDTYKSVKGLVNNGVKETHAKAFVELVRNNAPDLSHLVTKEQLKAEMTLVRAEIRTEIVKSKN